jgi:hypothetical protein
MVEENYILKKIKKTGVSLEEQVELLASILICLEVSWKMTAVRELGFTRGRSLSYAAWKEIGRWSVRMAKASGAKVSDLDGVFEVLKGAYRAFAQPIEILKDTPDEKLISVESCPMPDYAIPTFGIEKGDECTCIWRDDFHAWTEGAIEEAGLTGVITCRLLSSLCMGDKEEIVRLEKIKK